MGSAAPKKRPMRSVRSGIKKLELVKANLAILKKLAALFIIVIFASCVPVRYVDFNSHHNYYQRHRFETYTAPVWVPGRGVMLQTLPAPRQYRQPRRGKH
jgi:hypothetical protein